MRSDAFNVQEVKKCCGHIGWFASDMWPNCALMMLSISWEITTQNIWAKQVNTMKPENISDWFCCSEWPVSYPPAPRHVNGEVRYPQGQQAYGSTTSARSSPKKIILTLKSFSEYFSQIHCWCIQIPLQIYGRRSFTKSTVAI